LVSKEKVLDFTEKYLDKYTFYPASVKINDKNAFLIGKDNSISRSTAHIGLYNL
jgi:hypothetical protein